MPLVSPSKLLAVPGLPTSSVRNSFQGPESTYVRSPKSISFPYPSNILGIPLRDSSVLLPSPVGEVITRSPKAPANRIRFRGAGRQFAARSDSVAAFQSYEADLINASTMVIRQRGSIAASNNAPATSDEKNLSSPPSSYLSFPSVI
ncbi:hypothetical protein PR002_g14807 [Phytophthora rubi]|uniref:Uncharacterized protein n=1 Tax=Phytophthora rubi TaxID=129364 RepID=A0A6A3L8N7_9STRA|nr:hypothetical protein PR002_g14807 [Phytophthora rubi]